LCFNDSFDRSGFVLKALTLYSAGQIEMLRAFEKKIEIIIPDVHFLSLNGDLRL
jgi:hypothetical protein